METERKQELKLKVLTSVAQKKPKSEKIRRQVDALYKVLGEVYGTEQLVLKASKVGALAFLRSPALEERLLALERIIYEDPTLDKVPLEKEIPQVLEALKEQVSEIIARRMLEEQLERKVMEKMQQRQDEYFREIKAQVLRESGGPENAYTLKRLAFLEKLCQTKLNRSLTETLQPQSLEEIVGQERAVKALLTKIASRFPQHVILYGPPGVGKTTAARLVLKAAKSLPFTSFGPEAPFIEVNGATLRWDPREVTNPLLGSVHDPIYQGARRDLAETGVPEPKLGLVTEAHGGILFIDEIGEMDPLLLNKLLKVLEDKKVTFESSYYDAHDENIPRYIKEIFEKGAPADFILVGATTCDPEEINPALRSRCAEVYFDPLTPQEVQQIVRQALKKLGVDFEARVPEIISDYTVEGRKAINILADAFSLALAEFSQKPSFKATPLKVKVAQVQEVIQSARLSPSVPFRASKKLEVGRVLALGVSSFLGSVLEIEAIVFPAREPGKGAVRFNETAGSMARDSVFNAAAVVRSLTGEDLCDYDVHVNVVGGGNINGPSAGAAVCLAILSALEKRPVRQDLAITGEISIQGKIRPVGGISEKIYGARQAGIKKVLIPKENAADVPKHLQGIKVVSLSTIEEAFPHVFGEESLS